MIPASDVVRGFNRTCADGVDRVVCRVCIDPCFDRRVPAALAPDIANTAICGLQLVFVGPAQDSRIGRNDAFLHPLVQAVFLDEQFWRRAHRLGHMHGVFRRGIQIVVFKLHLQFRGETTGVQGGAARHIVLEPLEIEVIEELVGHIFPAKLRDDLGDECADGIVVFLVFAQGTLGLGGFVKFVILSHVQHTPQNVFKHVLTGNVVVLDVGTLVAGERVGERHHDETTVIGF